MHNLHLVSVFINYKFAYICVYIKDIGGDVYIHPPIPLIQVYYTPYLLTYDS